MSPPGPGIFANRSRSQETASGEYQSISIALGETVKCFAIERRVYDLDPPGSEGDSHTEQFVGRVGGKFKLYVPLAMSAHLSGCPVQRCNSVLAALLFEVGRSAFLDMIRDDVHRLHGEVLVRSGRDDLERRYSGCDARRVTGSDHFRALMKQCGKVLSIFHDNLLRQLLYLNALKVSLRAGDHSSPDNGTERHDGRAEGGTGADNLHAQQQSAVTRLRTY